METLLRLPATAKISKKPLVTASSPKSRSEKKVINQRQIILKTDSTLPLQCARTVKTYKYPVMTTNKLSKVGSASSITKGTMLQLRWSLAWLSQTLFPNFHSMCQLSLNIKINCIKTPYRENRINILRKKYRIKKMKVDYRSLNLHFVTSCQEIFLFSWYFLAFTTFVIFLFIARCQNKVSL